MADVAPLFDGDAALMPGRPDPWLTETLAALLREAEAGEIWGSVRGC